MKCDRIKEIQLATAYPDSHSVYTALMQVWQECAREKDRETTILHAELEHTQLELKRAQMDNANLNREIESILGRAQAEHHNFKAFAAMRKERDDAKADATAALDLVSRIRFALGDNGKRMQDELIEYCKKLVEPTKGVGKSWSRSWDEDISEARQSERNRCIETMYYLDWPEKGHSLASYRKAMEEKLGSL